MATCRDSSQSGIRTSQSPSEKPHKSRREWCDCMFVGAITETDFYPDLLKQACLDLIDFYWLFGWNEPLRVQRLCPPEPKARTIFLHLWFLFILGLKLIRVKKIRMVLRTWAKLLVTFPLNRRYLFLLFSFLFSFCCVCSVLLLLLVSFCALAHFWLFSHCLWGLWVLCEAVRCLRVKCAV